MKIIYTYLTTSSRWTSVSFHPLHQRTKMGLFIKNNTWHDIWYSLLLQYTVQNIKELLLLTSPSPPPSVFLSQLFSHIHQKLQEHISRHRWTPVQTHDLFQLIHSLFHDIITCRLLGKVKHIAYTVINNQNPKTYLMLILKSNNKTIRQYLSSFPASQSWSALFTLLSLQVTVHNFMRINLLALTSLRCKMQSFNLSWWWQCEYVLLTWRNLRERLCLGYSSMSVGNTAGLSSKPAFITAHSTNPKVELSWTVRV